MLMNIGRAIKFSRQQKCLSIPTLSKMAGISPSHLSLIERGKREPSLDIVERLCKELGIPMTLLVFLGAEPADNVGLSEEVCEKLSSAVIKLLQGRGSDEHQQVLV
jgi:transcriptional regulator with XRE-family HTH domain